MNLTLNEESQKVYFYHNGISAICNEVKPVLDPESGELSGFICKNFQVINRAQTTTKLARYETSKPAEGAGTPKAAY